MKPLVSVVVLSYWNFKYLFDAINSIFNQDYENIEIVISNDASEDFDENELILFLNQKRTENIKHIIINNNERNLGTVQNFNKAISMSTGEFILFLAGDDMLFNDTIISSYIDHYSSLDEDALLVNSGVTLFDANMDNPYVSYPSPEARNKLINTTPKELFQLLALEGCFFPTTCCVRKILFDKIGFVNNEIRLIEDWALYLMVLRNGIKVHYMDKITLKHRSGGICHGGDNYKEDLTRRFKEDEIKILELEILPYKKEFESKIYKKLKSKYNYLKASFRLNYEAERYKGIKKLLYMMKSIPKLAVEMVKRVCSAFKDACFNKFGQPYFVLITLTLGVIYSLVDFSPLVGVDISYYLNLVIGILAMFFISLFIIGIFARILRYILWPFKKVYRSFVKR